MRSCIDKIRVTDMPEGRGRYLHAHPRRRIRKKWQHVAFIRTNERDRPTADIVAVLSDLHRECPFTARGMRRVAAALVKLGHYKVRWRRPEHGTC